MSKHQIIYTSCKRGIDGISDGQQIYSYNEAFRKDSQINSLFTYQTPSLPSGVTMTEATAKTMPQSFTYRRLSDTQCAIVLNTYLGRDYMGETGRFGNHLSHVIICDDNEFSGYPCEFYGSGILRGKMDFNEVNSSERPPYLPEPELKKGQVVTPEKISGFLSENNRMEPYKKMLAAMLSFETQKKRVVICDAPENIIMWIAALHYSLPLAIALNINFTTYEYSPSLSKSNICGVVSEGTGYSANNAADHCTFDFFKNIIPEIKTEGDFFDFMDISMSMSFESLQAFHKFICDKLTYKKPNEHYYNIYSLYCLFTDSLERISPAAFDAAVKMSDIYSLEKTKEELLRRLIKDSDYIASGMPGDYSITIIKTLLSRMGGAGGDIQDSIKVLISNKVIASLSAFANKDDFIKFYSEIEALCRNIGIIIPYEFLKKDNRKKLLSVMNSRGEQWQYVFLLDILCSHAMNQGADYDITLQLIAEIVQTRMSSNLDNGYALLIETIDKFSHDWTCFIKTTLIFEGVLSSNPDLSDNVKGLWKNVCQTLIKKFAANRQDIYAFFLSKKKLPQILYMFKELIASSDSLFTAKKIFNELPILKNEPELTLRIYDYYYLYLTTHDELNTLEAQKEFLGLILSQKLKPPFLSELITIIFANFPIEKPSPENEKVIKLILTYQELKLTGHLPLVITGMIFNTNAVDFKESVKELKKYTNDKTLSLQDLPEDTIKKYTDWVVPKLYESCKTANDLINSYKLFEHTKSSSKLFIDIYMKTSIKYGADKKDYDKIIMSLKFLFDAGNDKEIQETAKYLKKYLGKNLEKFNELARKTFHDTTLDQWKHIMKLLQ
jgi:hypothetical protein